MQRSASVLNREIRYEPGRGITIEADPRHAKLIVQETGCEHMGTLRIPAARPNDGESDETKEKEAREKRKTQGKNKDGGGSMKLDKKKASRYRAIVARAKYLAILSSFLQSSSDGSAIPRANSFVAYEMSGRAVCR